MGDGKSKLVAYVELCRLSNAPTVISNVLVGAAIGQASGGAKGGESVWPIAGMIVAGLLLYAGGMALNDAFDASIDAKERPERVIPSGRISLRAAFVFGGVCLAVGCGMCAMFGAKSLLFSLALVAAIVAYDAVHKLAALSVVLMGGCRGLLYLTAASAMAWPLNWKIAGVLAGAITLYIIALTIVARVESRAPSGGKRRFLALLLPVVALAPLVWLRPEDWATAGLAGVAAIGWLLVTASYLMASPPQIGRAVHGWLAGICLIDAMYLGLLDRGEFAAAAAGCFLLTVIGHRYIQGT